jgi:hypothetical protein
MEIDSTIVQICIQDVQWTQSSKANTERLKISGKILRRWILFSCHAVTKYDWFRDFVARCENGNFLSGCALNLWRFRLDIPVPIKM